MMNLKKVKTAIIDNHMICAFAGFASDANKLIEWSRETSINWKLKFEIPIST
jgi:20S proteasome alpha/beta subunit